MTNRYLLLGASLLLLAAQGSHADLGLETPDSLFSPGQLTTPTSPILSQNDDGLKRNVWYSAGKTASMQIVNKKGQPNVNVGALDRLTLVEGTEFQILSFSKDGEYAKIGIDEDGFADQNPGVEDSAPVVAWVYTGDLIQSRGQTVDTEAVETAMLNDPNYGQAQPAETANARRRGGYSYNRGGRGRRAYGNSSGRRRSRGGGGGMTYCLRDVRITAAQYTKHVPQGIPMASIAYPKYLAAGWSRYDLDMKHPERAPKGTACFFGGGRPCGGHSYCGHATIKINKVMWKGAGVRPTPFLRSRHDSGRVPYKFQGCLTPPSR